MPVFAMTLNERTQTRMTGDCLTSRLLCVCIPLPQGSQSVKYQMHEGNCQTEWKVGRLSRMSIDD